MEEDIENMISRLDVGFRYMTKWGQRVVLGYEVRCSF
jgi:hypothetical protein